MRNVMCWCICWLVCMPAAQVLGEVSRRVFIVASYEQGNVCGGPQEDGFIQGLNKRGWFEGINLELERFYMDTKRTNTTPTQIRQAAAIARQRIKVFRPQIVAVVDDNAFREVGLALAGRDDISVVFTGLNGQPETYNAAVPFMESRRRPASNITGVYESLYVGQSIRVMQKALSNRSGRKILAIVDGSTTGIALSKQFELELEADAPGLQCELHHVSNWQQYTSLIETVNHDEDVLAIYPVALTLPVSDGVTYTAPEIFRWTIANSTKPEMALNYFFSEIGLFGGAAVDFKSMGQLAGKKAGDILNGRQPGDLPIEDAPDYAIVFNVRRAKSLGIEIPAPLLTAAEHIYK